MSSLREQIDGSVRPSEMRMAQIEQDIATIREYLKPPETEGPRVPDLILDKVSLLEEGLAVVLAQQREILDRLAELQSFVPPSTGR